MLLRDHPKFPKEKEVKEDSIVEQMRGIGDDGAYEKGYNSALRELGEIEILEEMDKGKMTLHFIIESIRHSEIGIRALTQFKEEADWYYWIEQLAKHIYPHFGTKKVSVEEIEKIILDSPIGQYDIDFLKDVRKLAIAIVNSINKGG